MKTEVEVGKESEQVSQDKLWNAMHRYNPDAQNTVAASGKGSWFTDEGGNKYLDGVSGLWCLNLGHGRQEIVDAAAEQMKNLSYFPLTMSHQPAVKLAGKIRDRKSTRLNSSHVADSYAV